MLLGSPQQGECEGETVFTGAESWSAPWDCTCSCEVAAPQSCFGQDVLLELYIDGDCTEASDTYTISGACQDFDHLASYRMRVSSEHPASCESEASPVRDPVIPIEPRVVCEAVDTAGCDGGTCVDASANLCVHHEGEVACPAGDFGVRTILQRGYRDERDCSPCSCEGHYACSGLVSIHGEPSGCTGPEAFILPIGGGCSMETSNLTGASVDFAGGEPTTTCEASGGELDGAVLGEDPITICCLE